MQPVNRATDSSPRSVAEHPNIQQQPAERASIWTRRFFPVNLPQNAMDLHFPAAINLQPRAAANPFRNTNSETGTATGPAAAQNPQIDPDQPSSLPFLPRP